MPEDSRHLSYQPTGDSASAAASRSVVARELQAAARDAYRTSVANGDALTGEALGKMFERSPRWGNDRISEVRAADIGRTNGTSRQNHLPAIRSEEGTTGDPLLPIRSTGDSPADAKGNGHDDDAPLPNRNRTSQGALPTRSNGTAPQPPPLRIRRSNSNDSESEQLPIRSGGSATNESQSSAGEAVPTGMTVALAGHATVAHEAKAPRSLIMVTVAAVVIVAAVTMVTSYTHMHDLAVMAGWGWLAWILPAAIDGLVVAGSTSLMVDRRLYGPGYAGHPLAWAAVAIGLASSMAANIVAVDPTLVDMREVRWVMAGYAPLALALSGHLLLRMVGERS